MGTYNGNIDRLNVLEYKPNLSQEEKCLESVLSDWILVGLYYAGVIYINCCNLYYWLEPYPDELDPVNCSQIGKEASVLGTFEHLTTDSSTFAKHHPNSDLEQSQSTEIWGDLYFVPFYPTPQRDFGLVNVKKPSLYKEITRLINIHALP